MENIMTHVNKLLGQYAKYFRETGMDIYMDDLDDFTTAMAFINDDDVTTAGNFIRNMDTDPRDNLLVALHADGFDINQLGFRLL